jgi:hypothetical protein
VSIALEEDRGRAHHKPAQETWQDQLQFIEHSLVVGSPLPPPPPVPREITPPPLNRRLEPALDMQLGPTPSPACDDI